MQEQIQLWSQADKMKQDLAKLTATDAMDVEEDWLILNRTLHPPDNRGTYIIKLSYSCLSKIRVMKFIILHLSFVTVKLEVEYK